MSYILDALKKAEAERHIGQVPGLHVQPAAALPPGPALGRASRVWLIAAAVLLASGAALAWLRPWQAPVPPSLPQPAVLPLVPSANSTAASPPLPAPPASASAHVPAPQIVAVSPPPEPPKPPARPAQKRHIAPPAAPSQAGKPAATVAMAKPPARQAAPAQPRPSTGTDIGTATGTGEADLKLSAALTPETGAASPRELPEQIQRELPKLAIGGYIYSDNPRERQLLVNQRLLHEGEEAAPGVILEKMLPKAAVFTYKGYRYRLAY